MSDHALAVLGVIGGLGVALQGIQIYELRVLRVTLTALLQIARQQASKPERAPLHGPHAPLS